MWQLPVAAWRALLASTLRDPVYGNGIALVANASLGAILGFLFWAISARLLPPATLGLGAAVLSAATLAALVGKAGLDAVVIRYVPAAGRTQARRLVIGAAITTMTLTALAAAALLALATGPLHGLAPMRAPQAAALFTLIAATTALGWVFDAYFVAEQVAGWALARNVAFHTVKLGAILLLAGALALPLAWALGLATSLALAGLGATRTLRQRTATPTTAPPRRKLAAYAVRNATLNLAEFVPGLVLPLVVLHMMGAEANATFYLAWSIATVGFLTSRAIAQSAFAALVRDTSPLPAITKGARLSALVLIPFTGLAILLANPILHLFGPHYAQAGPTLLQWLAASILPLAAWNHHLALLRARDATWELTLAPLLLTAAILAATPLALSWRGTPGVGMAWLGLHLLAGAYASIRLKAALSRDARERTRLHRRAHEG